jgi:hypothetical protein
LITARNIFVLIVVSCITFFVSNNLLDGTLKNTGNLSGEIKSPPDSLYRWNIRNEAPFKYRILHRIIVSGSYQALSQQRDNNLLFFKVYQTYAWLFHTGAILLFYYFLLLLGLKNYSLAGAILFALLPPMLLAYNVPVHTREDTLAYCILLAGLIAILKNQLGWVLILSVIGVLCRETLLFIPLIYLLYDRQQKLLMRVFVIVVSLASFGFLRWYFGLNPYDFAEGFNWNVRHPDQVIGFLYISFGFLWVPFIISLLRNTEKPASIQFIHRSGWGALAIILVTTFLGGIFNEIRLLYLLAPWIITLSLNYCNEIKDDFNAIFSSKKYLVFVGVSGVITVGICLLILAYQESFLHSSKYGISYPKWIIATCVQVFLTIITCPLFVWLRKV